MWKLKCERCGLRYGRAAIVREPALAPGAACRRCGASLRVDDGVAPAQPDGDADRMPFAPQTRRP
jgi:hypothetical protein